MKKRLVTLLMAVVATASVCIFTNNANAAELTEEQQITLSESINAIAKSESAQQIIFSVFDAEYYASVYPDVVAVLGSDPKVLFAHYINFGINEGRDASASFNLDAYVASNPDLIEAFSNNGININVINFVNHYIVSGSTEGRISTIAGAVEKGISVASISHPEVVLGKPNMAKNAWATGGSGGGSSSSSSSSSSNTSANVSNNTDSSDKVESDGFDREAIRKEWAAMPDEVFNSLSDEDLKILINNPNAVIGSDNKVYGSMEEYIAASSQSDYVSFDNGISYKKSDLLGYLDGVAIYRNENNANSLGEQYVTEDGQYANLTYDQFMAFMDAMSDKNYQKALEEANAYGTIYNKEDGTVIVERYDGTTEEVQSAEVNDAGNIVITYLDGTVYEQVIEYTPSEPVIPHLNSSDIPSSN